MRVALLSPLFEAVPPRFYGGTERVVYNLCRGLTEANVEVTVFASGDSTTEGRITPVVPKALRLQGEAIIDPHAYNLKMLAMVAERAREFDLIHNHHDYWMLPLSLCSRTPLLTTLHGRIDLEDLQAALTSFRESPFVSISASQRGPLPALNWVRTIHHGIEPTDFEFQPDPGKYLAFLGRIDPLKRPEWAIKIAKDSGVPLKIAAKIEGARNQEYFEEAILPHVDGRFIEFVGEISENEKSEFLGGALALAFPIDWPEPFGMVMIEALACGTPVLARPRGSAPEVIVEGVTGFIRESVDDLARTVPRLSSIDRSRCREQAESRFSLKRMTEEYLDVYRALIESHPKRSSQKLGARAAGHGRDLLSPFQRSAGGNP